MNHTEYVDNKCAGKSIVDIHAFNHTQILQLNKNNNLGYVCSCLFVLYKDTCHFLSKHVEGLTSTITYPPLILFII